MFCEEYILFSVFIVSLTFAIGFYLGESQNKR